MKHGSSQMALSPAGAARRGEILARAQGALRARRRRRWALIAASAVLVPAGAMLSAVAAHRLTAPRLPATPAPAAVPRIAFAVVRDDASILERVSVATQPLEKGLLIGDSELVDLLREAGTDEGTIRIGGRFMLASDLRREGSTARPGGPG